MNSPLPHDENVEIAALGSVIYDGNVIKHLQDLLEPEDLYFTKHKIIFTTMGDMYRKGIAIDTLTLRNELKSRGQLDEAGGAYYLTRLEELCPTSANFKHYANIIKEYSNKRKLAERLTRILSDLKDNKIDYAGATTQIEEIEIGFYGKSNLVPISAKDLCGDCEPVESLWGEIFYPACITQINSDPGVGKTTFMYNVCSNGVTGKDFLGIPFSKKLKVCYVDLETPAWKKGLKIRNIIEPDQELTNNLYFLGSLELRSDFSDLLNLCKKEEYDLLVFDTQSRILNPEQENDNSEANRMMGLLRRLANDTGCSIVLIHHTNKGDNKGVYKGRGASAVGAAVDVVVNMEILEEDVIKLKVDKNRIMGDYQTLYIKKIGEDQFEPYIPLDKTDSGFEKFKAQDFILGLSNESTIWATGNIQEKAQAQGFSEPTVKRAIRNLSETGKIKKIKHGVYEFRVKDQKIKSSTLIGKTNDLLIFSDNQPDEIPDTGNPLSSPDELFSNNSDYQFSNNTQPAENKEKKQEIPSFPMISQIPKNGKQGKVGKASNFQNKSNNISKLHESENWKIKIGKTFDHSEACDCSECTPLDDHNLDFDINNL